MFPARRAAMERPAVSFPRAVGASVILILGGAVATYLGLAGPSTYNLGWKVGHLLMVVFTFGITLTVAGLVDGGRRYLAAGIGLLYVATTGLVISHAPGWLAQGWPYGLLFIAWGTAAVIRLLVARSRAGYRAGAGISGERRAGMGTEAVGAGR